MTNANIISERLKNPPLSHEPVKKCAIPLLHLPRRGGEKRGGTQSHQFFHTFPFKKERIFRSQARSITPLWKSVLRGYSRGGVREDLSSRCNHRFAPRGRMPIGLSVVVSWVKNVSLTLALIVAQPGVALPHDNTRPAALRDVAFDQKLNQQVPLDLEFRDESGKNVQLANYFNGKPVILTFVYFKCRDLCPLLMDGLVRSLRALSFSAGNEFNLLTVSFDAHDTPALAAAKKNDFIRQYSRTGAAAGWHFLTGDGASIQKLADSVGFHYTYDEHTGEFAHATGIVLLTTGGKTSRYFYGIDFSPRDLRLGLIEAAAQKIGSPIDQLLLFCYHYDPVTGKYGPLITNVVRMAGLATALLLGGFIFVMLKRERSNAAPGERTA
jgi:protein SCO1